MKQTQTSSIVKSFAQNKTLGLFQIWVWGGSELMGTKPSIPLLITS